MSVKNTSDLRKMLLETIEQVKAGKIESKQAGAIAALSSKVLQSAQLDLSVLKYNARAENADQAGLKVLQLVNQ